MSVRSRQLNFSEDEIRSVQVNPFFTAADQVACTCDYGYTTKPRRMRSQFFRLAGFLALTAVLSAAAPPVTVHIEPAAIARRTFDPANPPAEMPRLEPPEIGQCVYEFSCEMETHIQRPALPFGLARARVVRTEITTRLDITLWTPTDGPEHVVIHEEAHREICEIYYRPAAEIARRLGEALVGTSLSSRARDERSIKAELQILQDQAIQAYLAETLTRCAVAQRRFDEITYHSRRDVSVREALAQAVAHERALYAEANPGLSQELVPESTPASTIPKRYPPTRPRSGS